VRAERGSTSLVAVAIVAVVMVLALGATDLARVLIGSTEAQNAADAAALAAAQELALSSGNDPADLGARYAALNGAELIDCRCEPGSFEALVTVRVRLASLATVPGERFVQARARAVVETGSP
jgi:secretion/DNA translocation related TadE-like protein